MRIKTIQIIMQNNKNKNNNNRINNNANTTN